MQQFKEILLDVWREACKHIDIEESVGRITALLERHMPLEQVLVRRIDAVRGSVETVAKGLAKEQTHSVAGRFDCPKASVERLVAWSKGGIVARVAGDPEGNDALSSVVPDAPGRDAILGPLCRTGEAMSMLVLIARAGHLFDSRHAEMAQILLEPFSVALENDQRLREMVALREAAEADKQSLLTRLGRKELGDVIIGGDTGLRHVMERVDLVAKSDVPVLIFGETGTGKELVARAIHRRSPRANGPVLRVNCGAIPPDLIDSQLFGHETGAFTGAVRSRKGWFERADGGTLFLDEIGELPPAAQVRLLRVLQDGWLERVGGHSPLNVDVRLVAATHRDLTAMVAEGRFREDLWYRIAVFPIFLPPLRERKPDIAMLARHFAERAAVRFGLPVLAPSESDIQLLEAYPWPGNVRELATVMDRAAILGNGNRLEVATSLGVMEPSVKTRPEERPPAAASQPGSLSTLNEAMREHIEEALKSTRGRVEGPFGAAALLRINPHTLRARMRKLGIVWSRFRNC